jgi:diadenosine tetraphosphate (Ap4A) HIT family hydrolase
MSCILCRGIEGDAEMGRVQVWEDELWRLTTSVHPTETVAGFSYLEPKRHIEDITRLGGDEAQTFGPTIGRATAAIKRATGAELVYVYVFGGHVPHLHLHLAPHREGDSLNDAMTKGEVEEQLLPGGAVAIVSKDYPAVAEDELRATADRIRGTLS